MIKQYPLIVKIIKWLNFSLNQTTQSKLFSHHKLHLMSAAIHRMVVPLIPLPGHETGIMVNCGFPFTSKLCKLRHFRSILMAFHRIVRSFDWPSHST